MHSAWAPAITSKDESIETITLLSANQAALAATKTEKVHSDPAQVHEIIRLATHQILASGNTSTSDAMS